MPLNVVEVPQFSATVPVGQVISQSYDPPPNADGAIDVNATVTIYVSLGSGVAAVPDIVALGVLDAGELISINGLVKGAVTYVVNPSAPYVVTAQNPPAATSVSPGSAVDFTVTVPGAVSGGHQSSGGRMH